jgi:hypothetical protein
LRDKHGGERHDDRLQAEKGDEEAIEDARRHADTDTGQRPQDD